MESITITKDGPSSTFSNFSYSYDYVTALEPIGYYYVSKDGEKIYRNREKKEHKISAVGLAYLAIQIFKQNLDGLNEIERNELKTDATKYNVGIWKDREKFINKWGNPKANPSNVGKDYIRADWINPYRENGIDIYYFYSYGLFDSLEMCASLMKKFNDDGKFIIEFNDINPNPIGNEPPRRLTKRMEQIFPINQILYGPPGTGKTYNTVNKALEIIYGEDFVKENNEDRKKLKEEFEELSKNGQIVFVTFHQSMSYEDFIEGIKPKLNKDEDSKISYEIKSGIFREICKKAEKDPENEYILIIDEINRGNVSQIFGELITLIEEDKRLGKNEELKVTLPYSGDKFGVPNNLYIIGTMNTADRSVEALDTALRRRFSFIEMMPYYELEGLKRYKDIDLPLLLEKINKRIEKLLDREHQIGHSYFLKVEDLEGLRRVFKDNILPLLQEYFFGDYGKIGKVLGKKFVEKIPEKETEFADFDYEIEGKDVYKLKDPFEKTEEGDYELTIGDFKSIYE